MEEADDLYKSRWASKLAEYRPERSSVHSVECLGWCNVLLNYWSGLQKFGYVAYATMIRTKSQVKFPEQKQVKLLIFPQGKW